MQEQLILGAVQGITEWLPVSSEGLLVLIKVNIFNSTAELTELAQESLFLHLGTVLAAVVYMRREVWNLLQTVSTGAYWGKVMRAPQRLFDKTETTFGAMDAHERVVSYLLLTTLLSGILGLLLLNTANTLSLLVESYSQAINILVGLSLVATGILLHRSKHSGNKKRADINLTDTIVLGIVQGFAAIPGLSRSGLTVAALLMKRYEKTAALRLSFLMSIPLVLAGNILLNLEKLLFTPTALWGLLSSFVFGLLTIHLLLQLARTINFGYLVIGFGILTLIAAML